jgi:hypothetical protein
MRGLRTLMDLFDVGTKGMLGVKVDDKNQAGTNDTVT